MFHNIVEHGSFILEKVIRWSKLSCLAVFHHKNLVWITNCVDSMGYCQYSAILEVFSQCSLDLFVGLKINRWSCLYIGKKGMLISWNNVNIKEENLFDWPRQEEEFYIFSAMRDLSKEAGADLGSNSLRIQQQVHQEGLETLQWFSSYRIFEEHSRFLHLYSHQMDPYLI